MNTQITVVRPMQFTKPVGATASIYLLKSDEAKPGDHIKITDREGNSLNIARVNRIENNNGGSLTAHLVMIA